MIDPIHYILIAGGSLFGAAGLILAAPLTSATTPNHIRPRRGPRAGKRGAAVEEPMRP